MVGRTSVGGRGRRLAAFAAAILLSATTPGLSQTSADELARKHFESGVAYLQESDYPSALKAFDKAYELSKRVEILLNIATVHERSGDLPSAVDSLKRYLELDPNGKHVETVKLRLANLEKRIASAPAASDAGTPADTDAASAPPPTTAPPPPPPPTAPPPVVDRPEPNRLPAYVAFGVGGLAAAGAVITGVLAQGEYDDANDSCAPRCSDDQVASGKSLAVTSTILTGVAVVGVSLGAVLWFTASSPTEPSHGGRKRFDVRVGGGPDGARAHALWRF